MISWKKQNHIDQVDLQSFHEGLPQYDEDGFMAELQARPDQDELEESKSSWNVVVFFTSYWVSKAQPLWGKDEEAFVLVN